MGRALIKVGAAALAIALLGAAAPPQQKAKRPEALPSAKSSTIAPRSAGSGLSGRDVSTANRPCERGKEDRRSDLCAQWKAADAAARAADWTQLTGIFSGLGLVLGLGTLVAAGLAAKFAKEAADHTKSAADQAASANLLAKETQQIELRPWIEIGIEPLTFEKGEHATSLSYEVTCRNVGQTLATSVWIRFEVKFNDEARQPLSEWVASHLLGAQDCDSVLIPSGSIKTHGFWGSVNKNALWQSVKTKRFIFPKVYAAVFYKMHDDDTWRHSALAVVLGAREDAPYSEKIREDQLPLKQGEMIARLVGGYRAT